MNTKKEFQKVVAAIRADAKKENPKAEYPKAMMTSQQMEKNTATVNCGHNPKESKKIAKRVLEDPRFHEFMSGCNVTHAIPEIVKDAYDNKVYQLRLRFAEG